MFVNIPPSGPPAVRPPIAIIQKGKVDAASLGRGSPGKLAKLVKSEKLGKNSLQPVEVASAATVFEEATWASPYAWKPVEGVMLAADPEPPAGGGGWAEELIETGEGENAAVVSESAVAEPGVGEVSDSAVAEEPAPVMDEIPKGYYMAYTYELTTTLVDNQVTGDATKSFEPEQRYYEENINVRGVGGFGGKEENQAIFGFQAVNSTKLNEPTWLFDRANLGLITPKYTLDLWDILPTFSEYTLASKRLQGLSLLLNYQRSNLTILYGFDNQLSKAIGLHRRSLGVQLLRKNEPKSRTWSLNMIHTYDTEPVIPGDPVQHNTVFSFTHTGGTKKFISWESEFSQSFSNDLGQGWAMKFDGRKKKGAYLLKGAFESVDPRFNTLTGNVTSGMKETRGSLKYAFSKSLDVTLGYKDRDFPTNRTEEVPTIVNWAPLKSRPKFQLNYIHTDKKLASTTDKLVTTLNDYQIKDNLGTSKIRLKYQDETRDKLNGSNQDKRTIEVSTDTPIGEKFSVKSKYKRFSQQTLSRFKDYGLDFSYSLSDWSDVSLRYAFKDAKGATSDKENWTLGWTNLDVENDREYSFKFKRDGFKEFTLNSFEFRLGLVY